MRCLICVSLRDVCGTVFYHALLFATADLRLTFLCPKQADIRGLDDKLSMCEDRYRVNQRPGVLPYLRLLLTPPDEREHLLLWHAQHRRDVRAASKQ